MSPPLRLLVDSCVAGAVSRRLRADGHDVLAMAEHPPDPGDAAILTRAIAETRVLITIDTDFGALVFRDGAFQVGVLRLREARAAIQAERASVLIQRHGDVLVAGAFVTDDGDSERITPPRP